MEPKDTIIVYGYDLIWYDINLDPKDVSFFFFKEDPVSYLRNLSAQGWKIILYWPIITNELDRFPTLTRQDADFALANKHMFMNLFFAPFSTIVELEPGQMSENLIQTLETLIDVKSPASFAILEADRNLEFPIQRYTSDEIFGFVDPPPVIPNALYLIVPDIPERRRWFLQNHEYNVQFTAIAPEGRIGEAQFNKINKPDMSIVQVWTPVFRYAPNVNRHNVRHHRKLGRPDQDNVQGVIYYTYGF